MKNLSIMIKPASSLCNLRCKYCFYADVADLRDVRSYGVMDASTTEGMLKAVGESLQPGDRVVFAFQGGEPTMAGLDYFRHFLSITSAWNRQIHIDYALQTNATLLDEEWCAFLQEHRFLVGVSFDILQDCHDAARLDASGKGTCRRVEKAIRILEKCGVAYNVLCTLTNAVARHPQQVWNRIQQLDLRYVQFTPCLDELECPGESEYSLTPRRFADFYDRLFQYWLKDYQNGRYRSIKLFDDIIHYIAFGIPNACGIGGQCQPQIIIEADGSVYPCNFYCLDAYRLGNILEQNLQDLLLSPAMQAFHQREHAQPELCSRCDLLPFCGGGCKRMQRETCCVGTDDFCGYGSFLRKNFPTLRQIAQGQVLRQRGRRGG